MKFRVYNDYEENSHCVLVPVPGNGYKDIEIDIENEHKYFYLKLANCFRVNEKFEIINFGEEIEENIFSLIEQFGNLGCSPIEKRIIPSSEVWGESPSMWFEMDGKITVTNEAELLKGQFHHVLTKRPPSNRDYKTNTFIANGDYLDWMSNIEEAKIVPFEKEVALVESSVTTNVKVNFQAVSGSPSLQKALLDLTILLKQVELGDDVNLELLDSHLIQCNVTSILEKENINGKTIYKNIPHLDNLLGLAFWQFQQLLLENNPSKIAVCKMCGNYFEKRSHKGLFCNESITGEYGAQIKVNSCTSRFNSLKARVKKTYVSDAALTIDDLAKKHTKCSLELLEEFIAQWEAEGVERIHHV